MHKDGRPAVHGDERVGQDLAGVPAELDDAEQDFGEVLRHELNHPLTGILGNAELLLAQIRRKSDGQVPNRGGQRRETIRHAGGALAGNSAPAERGLGSAQEIPDGKKNGNSKIEIGKSREPEVTSPGAGSKRFQTPPVFSVGT